MNEPDKQPQVAALFAAPEGPEGTSAINEADPLYQLGEEERELARLRLMPVNELVLEYLGTRDNLDNARHDWQKVESDLKGRLATMSMVMREKADSIGVDNFNIRGVGTAYRNTKVSYRVGDWETFIQWVASTNNFQCLEKRVAKLATADVEKDLGKEPPGIDKVVEVEFLVRRAKA